MKTLVASLFVATLIAPPAYAAEGHDLKPKHGGVVTAAKDLDFELVAKASQIQLYLRDHGKPLDVSKSSAKLTILTGGQQEEVELKPAGAMLEAKGSYKVAAGSKVVASVTHQGKSTTARFVVK